VTSRVDVAERSPAHIEPGSAAIPPSLKAVPV
jgi:hypothetical protein